jgi:hypothetical protein
MPIHHENPMQVSSRPAFAGVSADRWTKRGSQPCAHALVDEESLYPE